MWKYCEQPQQNTFGEATWFRYFLDSKIFIPYTVIPTLATCFTEVAMKVLFFLICLAAPVVHAFRKPPSFTTSRLASHRQNHHVLFSVRAVSNRGGSLTTNTRALSVVNQTKMVALFYAFHIGYLSQKTVWIPFLYQLTGIRHISADAFVGLLWIVLVCLYQKLQNRRSPLALLDLCVNPDRVPWRRPKQHPAQTAVLIVLLFGTYLFSGFLQPAISTLLNIAAVFVPLTIPMQRNLLVLITHLCWVFPAMFLMRGIKGINHTTSPTQTHTLV